MLAAYIVILCPRGNESNIKEGERKSKRKTERGRVERGRESLVKWNLVTDASEGGAALQGRLEVVCCVYVCLAVRVRVYQYVHVNVFVCVQACAGKGQDMGAH